MKLLVVDDEKMIRQLIAKYAVFDGYEVAEAENGMQAVEMARAGGYDLIIMDIMMPELDGFSAAREIRKTSDVPIIFLSARGEEYDRIHGFELGVDDYVVKPFSPRELMMRVGAVLRRAQAPGAAENVHETVRIENMLVDFTARQVTIDGTEVELSPKEYDLLFFMVRNRGIALTRDRLISEVWGYDFFGDDRTLDTHIKLLRKQLLSFARYITTLRGVGYRFEKRMMLRRRYRRAGVPRCGDAFCASSSPWVCAAAFFVFSGVYGTVAHASVAVPDRASGRFLPPAKKRTCSNPLPRASFRTSTMRISTRWWTVSLRKTTSAFS